jgi:hypothetical protein
MKMVGELLHVTPHTLDETLMVSLVTRHMSHVTRHTSHVTRHTSHVTLHTLHVTLHNSHVTRHSSHFTGDYCLNTPELNIHNCVRLLGHNWTRPPPSQDDDDFNSFDFELESQEEKSKVTNPTTRNIQHQTSCSGRP